MQNRRCLVIGGGIVAQRKVSSLLKAGAEVLVVSKTLTSQLTKWAHQGRIGYRRSGYTEQFLDKVFLVIAATDDGEINSRVYREAGQKGILVNCVDAPDQSTFIVPAVCCRGDVIIAVSTSGRAPGFAKRIKEELNNTLAEEYKKRVQIISAVRKKIKNMFPAAQRKKIVNRLAALSSQQLKKDGLVKKILK